MIHKYLLNGYYIIIDAPSGAVHSADELSYKLLEHLSPPLSQPLDDGIVEKMREYGEEDVRRAYDELYALYKAGLLFSEDEKPEVADLVRNSPVKALCLHIAHDCNLKCEYCFAAQGDFGQGREFMSAEVGKAAIDFLIQNSGTRHNLEVDFFGGEPLMNFETVKSVVEYAREKEAGFNKNFRFTLTTNGLLLNEDNMEYINREMSNVVLSLDGRREVNDRMRPNLSGGGSYDIITPKYQRFIEKRGDKDYYLRGTFTKYNLDFAADVLHMKELGFDQLSIEPSVGDPALDHQFDESNLPAIFAEYEKLAIKLLEREEAGEHINFFHFMLDLSGGPCILKRLRGCGSGNEYLAVTPSGDLYPCHQFVGMDEWRMGSVLTGDLETDKRDVFVKTSVYDKPECDKCWAKYYCSGGCNANNLQYAGDMLKPYSIACEMEKKRLECAIMMKVALSGEESE